MKQLLLLFIFQLLSFTIKAQEYSYENLVFEGAGIRGIAYCGVLQVLEERGILTSIKQVGGTSAGAITALLVAVGFTAQEIEAIIFSTDFQNFNDGEFIFFGGLHRLNKRFGWYKGEQFKKWLEQLMVKKTGNAHITFSQLSRQGYKNLAITATCLNQQKLLVLSESTYPNMKVVDAIRISMSIPLYFQAVFVDNVGKTYKKQNQQHNLDIMVDGGIIGNFPIHMFDSKEETLQQQTKRITNMKTLGIRIDTDEQIKNDTSHKQLAPYTIQN